MRVETYTNTFIRNHGKLLISRQRQKQNTRHNKRDKETLEDYSEVSHTELSSEVLQNFGSCVCQNNLVKNTEKL